MNRHRRLWRLWLAFYLIWTASTAFLVYDDAKEAAQTFSKSRAIEAGQPIDACDVMGEMVVAGDHDQKLMDLYYAVYKQRTLGDVRGELKTLNALESYFVSTAETTGQHPHLDHDVHAVLRACAKARVRIDEAMHSQSAALRDLAFYAGVVIIPPFLVLLSGVALLRIVSAISAR
ncbi:MAG: hypothetical protein ACE5NW_05245 [Acidiferrobacterales bacterium]